MFDSNVAVNPAESYPALAAAIAAVPARAARGGTAAECDLRVRSLLELSSQVQARLLSEIAAFDDQGFAASVGAKSTGSYLASHGHLDAGQARRLVVAARTADRLPQLGTMLTAGAITLDHVAAVGFSTTRVPSDVVVSFDEVFSTLAASALPSQLRIAGKHLQAVYDADATIRDAAHAHESRYLTLAPTTDGVWHLEGKLAPEDGLALSLAVDSLSSKRGAEDERTATQRRADGLVELAALAVRTGDLPDTGGDQPRVTLLLQATTNPFADAADELDDDSLDDEPAEAFLDSRTADGSGSCGLSLSRHLAGKIPQQRAAARSA